MEACVTISRVAWRGIASAAVDTVFTLAVASRPSCQSSSVAIICSVRSEPSKTPTDRRDLYTRVNNRAARGRAARVVIGLPTVSLRS
jgi:hypothetical protein